MRVRVICSLRLLGCFPRMKTAADPEIHRSRAEAPDLFADLVPPTPLLTVSRTRRGSPSRRVVGARSTERRHPDAQVGDGEAVQVPRPAATDLLGLRAPQRGEFALEPQPRELLDDAPADRVGDLVAARAE